MYIDNKYIINFYFKEPQYNYIIKKIQLNKQRINKDKKVRP